VVKTSDPAKTKRTIDALRRLVGASSGVHISALRVPGADAGFAVRPASGPRVNVGLEGDKFVVAVGNASAFSEAARSSGATLGTSSTFTDAASKLGNGLRPSLFLDVPQVVKLIDAFAGNQAEFQMAKPYLQAFGAVVAGGKDEGNGIVRYRFAVTLP
jgi:hypothetical protein